MGLVTFLLFPSENGRFPQESKEALENKGLSPIGAMLYKRI
jgi:hypothetical protein